MPSYLETNYFRKEYGKRDYPQKICNYIFKRFFKHYAIKNKKKCRILDIGSGKGNHLVGFSRCGLQAYGIDKRRECVEILKNFTIESCDLEKDKLPYKDNFFDFVFSKSVIEHISNTENILKEALRVLKPGGIAVIMTPDWKSQFKNYWDDYTHVKAFTRKGLQNAMRINGFSEVSCEYFLQLPFIWEYPCLNFIPKIISLLPDYLKWKDRNETSQRKLIRFAKEKMLLATGHKK
ncbi:class I SAM-dependent methyltransferase [Candidatus Woesearchaeota archaeon]|nr:class I SAM-dependent methyltransferase [Candidatus Woesearchaeota archaeon]